MSLNRRDLLQQAVSGAILAPLAIAGTSAAARSPSKASSPKSAIRREDTILRLGGLGDGYKMTWAADDCQYFGVNDGTGWLEKPLKFYNSRMWAAVGDPANVSFRDVPGYPELNKMTRPDDAPSYYGHGTLAVRGRLYQFLSTLDQRTEAPRRWTGAKLICSHDNGRTWLNQDGSAPVSWEDWGQQAKSLAFFREPQGCFSLISILQMGRDYSANRDGYIYMYSPNGSIDGQMNDLVMCRVPVERIADHRAYTYFAGWRGDGTARWARDIQSRAIVHSFPKGWVNRTNLFSGDLVVEAWLPSVAYVAALDRYLMAASGTGCAPDGTEFGKPSYLGLWIAKTPWGPWNQIHEETAWTPGGDAAACAYAPQIAPKWIAADGRSFWLVWADLQGIRSFTRDRSLLAADLAKAADINERTEIIATFHRKKLPHYAFNTQRVDLVF